MKISTCRFKSYNIFFVTISFIIVFFNLLPKVCDLYFFGNNAHLFYGIDDSLYLLKPFDTATRYNTFWNYFETTSSSEVLKPNWRLDYIVGILASFFKLTPYELGIALDIIFGLFSCYLFCIIFRLFTNNKLLILTALVASVFVLSRNLQIYFLVFDFRNGFKVLVDSYTDYDPPVFRALYTQVSYPIFLYSLFRVLKSIKSDSYKLREWITTGILSGLQIYLYFFPWIVSLCITSTSLVLLYLKRCKAKILYAYIAFGISLTLVSSIAILEMLGTQEGIATASSISKVIFFSPISLIVPIVLTSKYFFSTKNSFDSNRLLVISIVTFFVIENVLMNLQPVLGKAIAPYHFSRFYLHPILHSIILIFIGEKFLKINKNRSLKLIFIASSILIIGVGLFQQSKSYSKLIEGKNKTSLYSSKIQLFDYIQNNISRDSVFSLSSYKIVDEDYYTIKWFPTVAPNLLTALTGRFVLHQDWSYDSMYTSLDLEREFLNNFLVNDVESLYLECPYELKTYHDLFSLTIDANKIRREFKCQHFEHEIANLNVCNLSNKYKFDYLILTKNEEKNFKNINKIFRNIWSDTNGNFFIYKINKKVLINKFCEI